MEHDDEVVKCQVILGSLGRSYSWGGIHALIGRYSYYVDKVVGLGCIPQAQSTQKILTIISYCLRVRCIVSTSMCIATCTWQKWPRLSWPK